MWPNMSPHLCHFWDHATTGGELQCTDVPYGPSMDMVLGQVYILKIFFWIFTEIFLITPTL